MMHGPRYFFLMVCIVALWQMFDLVRTLKTGRAKTWMDGTATRDHQPKKYWRYVIEGYVMLALCATGIIVVILWPNFFR